MTRASTQGIAMCLGRPSDSTQALDACRRPGISAWFVAAKFEEQEGKPAALTLGVGQAMDPRSMERPRGHFSGSCHVRMLARPAGLEPTTFRSAT